MKRKITIALLIFFVVHLLFRVYMFRESYLTPYDAEYWKQKYENSQWSTKPACENLDLHINPYTCTWDDAWYSAHKNDPSANDLKRNPIGDDALYTFAGWEYIHGHDPTTLNAELPPFGKYLIGLSEIVFQNQNIFALASGLCALLAFYLLNTTIFKDKLYAFLPVFFLSFEPLFFNQLNITLLDLLYFSLLCLTFYLLSTNRFIWSAVFLGLMAGTKASVSTFPFVIGIALAYLILSKQFQNIKKYLITLPIAFLTFLLIYIWYFLKGHSLVDFLGVQKWIISFYASGAKGSLTAPWEIMFTGRYANWWGEQSIVSEWHLGWPLLFVASTASIVFIIKKRLFSKPIILLAMWTFAYLLFLSFIPTWSRYFLLILPFMYTLTIWLILRRFLKHEKI